MATKRKHSAVSPDVGEPVDPSDELLFLCLGGGNEVGRSCHVVQYKGKTVMLDAGMHPAYEGLAALPFFDEFDLSTIDVLLISHFHIDHAASLPYVLSKTNFRGRIFMTHPTKAIYKWLIQDSVRVGNTSSGSSSSAEHRGSPLYTEHDHLTTFPLIEAIDYHTTHTVSSIRITPYPAGHVLGAAMYHLDIAGLSILFTGDYSRENDRHLIPASIPKGLKVDVLITESTYGVATHIPRAEREAGLMRSVTSILDRGGRVLLPVFALGMAQELLLIFDEYWSRHPNLQKVPIYYASNLARKCMIVYQTYIGAMNENIRRLFRERMAEAEAKGNQGEPGSGGPWDFKHIRSLKSLERFDDLGPCVMLASPGMMQNGVSRELLERWAPDAKNGVVITGYSVEGTMAKSIMNEPEMIPAIMTRAGGAAGPSGSRRALLGREAETTQVPRRCTIHEFSFAAHVDGQENREFIEEVAAPVVILVHGERNAMARLKSRLLNANKEKPEHLKTKVFSPHNCEELRIPIRRPKTAKVVGRLAERINPELLQQQLRSRSEETDGIDSKSFDTHEDRIDGQIVRNAVLVQSDLKLSLMDPEDLREYAGLTTTTVTCRQKITLASASIELIRWALAATFGGVVDLGPRVTELHDDLSSENHNIDGSAGKQQNGIVKHEQPSEGPSEARLLVMDVVTLTWHEGGAIEVEWEGNVMNDGIADSVMAVLLSVESSPASVRQSSKLHSHEHGHAHGHTPRTNGQKPNGADAVTQTQTLERTRDEHVKMILRTQFGTSAITDCTATSDDGAAVAGMRVSIDDKVATVRLDDLNVECANAPMRDRVRAVVERAVECAAPLSLGSALDDSGDA